MKNNFRIKEITAVLMPPFLLISLDYYILPAVMFV